MISSSLTSQFVLIDSVSPTDSAALQFGQKVNWLSNDLFSIVSNIDSPFVSDDIKLSDATYFDGDGTQFGDISTSFSQKIDVYQILKTNREWINSPSDILKTVPVTTIPITGIYNTNVVYAGAIDNLFLADAGNPDSAIKIFNNPSLTHGWTVFTAQEQRLDSGSISQAWIYDSVTQIKLADLEVVDIYAGILPGTISSELDFVCDIDPACYNILPWIPGTVYAIGNRVLYGGQIYQALYSGKSGSMFSSSLWLLVTSQPSVNTEGITKWGANQIGRTWFNTTNLKAVNAQLGTLSERAQNWNTWFPNSAIQIFEWVNSSVPPVQYTSNAANGFVIDPTISYTYDLVTNQYGFWVFAKDSASPLHNQTTAELIADVSNIPDSGIPMITAIDTNAVAVWNINQFVSNNTVILHIDYVTESANNQLHNEFALISNDGTKSWYTTSIYPKLIDSLSGVSTTNQLVPDFTLPTNQQTGILNNPVQSLFVNRSTALDIYFSIVNQQLANIAIATTAVISALSASDPLPTSGFNEQISDRSVLDELDSSLYPENYRILLTQDDTLTPPAWSIVAIVDGVWQLAQYQTYNLANNWEYTDWYSVNYTDASPTYVLNNPGELSFITYVAGDIVQILNNGNGNQVIFLAVINDIDPAVTELDPIYIQNGTIQFLPNLYDFLSSDIGFDNQPFDSQPFDNDPYLAIRFITQILNDTIFVGSDILTASADDGFYSILNYILFENQNLDWLFKTSFVTVDYNNRNLDIQGTFSPDNQSSIEDFVSETLPFHIRVREFRDTFTSNDYGNIGANDFDIPSQYDSNYANIVYEFSPNSKLNTQLPLSPFQKYVGVSSYGNSCYIKSDGIPQYPTMESTPQNWQFGFVKIPITRNIKYDTVPDTSGPIAVAIDGVPFFSPNSGETETLYQYGNISQPLANIANQSTYTINSVWEAQANDLDPGAGFTNINGAYEYLTYPYILANSAPNNSPITGVQDTPRGVLDGFNDTFVLNYVAADPNSLLLSLDGVVLTQNEDYTLVGQVVTFFIPPMAGLILTAYYDYGVTIPVGLVEIIPTGILDDVNTIFTLPSLPSPALGLKVFYNGLLQSPIAPTSDYTLTGNTITCNVAPISTGSILAQYRLSTFVSPYTYADAITPTGAVDGVNYTFTLPNSPDFIELFYNGQLLISGEDFTIVGNTITYLVPPILNSINLAYYAYNLIELHSPLIGYAWDGGPIYGPDGYLNANGSGGVITNTTSYTLSSVPRLDKTGQPIINGLQMAVYATPTGEYIEDFVYVPNLGTLDDCNGRFVATPEYPAGVYAYFATVNPANSSIPLYPYIVGPCYNSKPFGLRYTYIDGVNTPVYLNGNVSIPLTPFIDTIDLVRSPDGSIVTDILTLQEPVYASWNNNHTYSIENLLVERTGSGYLDLLSDIVITPTNNASAVVSGLQMVSTNLIASGNSYVNGEILAIVGGTYGNAALIQVSNVNVAAGNSIIAFTSNINVANVNSNIVFTLPSSQEYTVLPSNLANVATTSLTGNGSGAILNVAFGIESVTTVNGGNLFTFTPSVVVIDANATTPATVYPELTNGLVRQISTTLSFARVNTSPYPGVFVDAGTFTGSYPVPTGTIFDSNDATAGQTSLNISWRPELISDTSLSTEYSRFGNTSGIFNTFTDQYIIANIASPDLNTLSINANNFTLEFFMNFSNITSNLSVILDTRANVSSHSGLVVFCENGNLCIGSNSSVAIINTGTPFVTNDWEYITLQGNSGNLYAYMNGELVGSSIANANANIASYNFTDYNLTLGADVGGGNVCTGYMDEIRLTTDFNRYIPGIINIDIPAQAFPRSLAVDPYLLPQYTPLLWGFESLDNESKTNISFISVNAQTLISDLSWNQKKLQLVNYGANLVVDSTTINIIENPQTSEILVVKLNLAIPPPGPS